MFGHTEPFDEQYHCYSGAFADKPQLKVEIKSCSRVGVRATREITDQLPLCLSCGPRVARGRTAACSSSRRPRGTSICPTG